MDSNNIRDGLYRYERACALLYARLSQDMGDKKLRQMFKGLAISEFSHASILNAGRRTSADVGELAAWTVTLSGESIDGASQSNPALRWLWKGKSPRKHPVEDILAFVWAGEVLEAVVYRLLHWWSGEAVYGAIAKEESNHTYKLKNLTSVSKRLYWLARAAIAGVWWSAIVLGRSGL